MDSYLHLENPMGSKDWSYNKFTKLVETPDFFHLYMDERSFFLIPKDAFAGSNKTHEIRLMLRDKISHR
jgi:hypothetical protein